MAMTRDQLLARLRELHAERNDEIAHIAADDVLVAYVNDPEVTAAYAVLRRHFTKAPVPVTEAATPAGS